MPRNRVNRVAGASAGSLIAAYYLMDLPLSACIREIIELTEGVRSRPLGVFDRSHQIVDLLPELLDRLFPDDAHKQVSGRLHVCMTRLKDMKKVIVNEFESKKDLIDVSCCALQIACQPHLRASTTTNIDKHRSWPGFKLQLFHPFVVRRSRVHFQGRQTHRRRLLGQPARV